MIKIKQYALAVLIFFGIFLLAAPSALACPNCFASSGENIVHAYYTSFVVLSGIPLGILTFGLVWFLRVRRQMNAANQRKAAA